MGSRGSAVSQEQQRPRERSPMFSLRPPRMSRLSSAQVPNSAWADENFLLGAGMVVFQPATEKVIVVYERQKKYWFLPKGRKDVGESLETAALREAYEESSYRVEFLPLYTHTSAPLPPSARTYEPNSEPIYICTAAYPARKRRNMVLPPGEYLTFWYVGQIPADAVPEEGTRMPDEVNYETHLLTVEDALRKLYPEEARVVHYAATLYDETRTYQEELRLRQVAIPESGSFASSSSSSFSSAPDHPASG
ncbi:hypothetical protein FB451DRAFT_1098391 [Mycena latifolia]|nr:hypothetical protein FB451DRAFT_1098391 [Mycena latifolia]